MLPLLESVCWAIYAQLYIALPIGKKEYRTFMAENWAWTFRSI